MKELRNLLVGLTLRDSLVESQHQSQLSTLNGSIQKLQSEIASLHSTTEAADCHLVAVQAEMYGLNRSYM